jgi:hypothetical protein
VHVVPEPDVSSIVRIAHVNDIAERDKSGECGDDNSRAGLTPAELSLERGNRVMLMLSVARCVRSVASRSIWKRAHPMCDPVHMSTLAAPRPVRMTNSEKFATAVPSALCRIFKSLWVDCAGRPGSDMQDVLHLRTALVSQIL